MGPPADTPPGPDPTTCDVDGGTPDADALSPADFSRFHAGLSEYQRAVEGGRTPDPAVVFPGEPHLQVLLARRLVAATPAAAASGPTGGRIGRGPPAVPGYAVGERLGEGGMGVVYRAHHVGLNRPVALKVIAEGAGATDRHLLRFLAEAEAVAAVKHAHVVGVYDFGEHEGRPYLALEFCPKGTLAHRLRAGRLDPREAAGLVERLARGVQAVHDAGVIHRDLKPANVLFDADGQPKVADFGLAKRGTGSDLTRTDAVLGTPHYMAPEQARGGRLAGPAADVWALGVILYECLTGTRPFAGDDAWAILRQVNDREPDSVRSRAAGVPRDLELICARCLRKEPHERYPTAAGLADDLGAFLAGRPVAARPVGAWERAVKWARRNPAPAALATGLVAVLVAGSAVSAWQAVRATRAADRADDRATAAAAAQRAAAASEAGARRLLGLSATTEALRLADDGDLPGCLLWIAEGLRRDPDNAAAVAAGRVRFACYYRYAPQFRLVQVVVPGDSVSELSPALDRCLGSSDHVAWVWDVATGRPVGEPLDHGADIYRTGFSPDGRRVVTLSREGTVRVWDVATGRPTGPPLVHGSMTVTVVFSPDGGRVAVPGADGVIKVFDAITGGQVCPPLRHDGAVVVAAFSADGRRLVTGDLRATARVWDAATGAAVSPPLKHDTIITAVGFSPDGARVVVGVGNGTVRVWDARTGASLIPPLRHADAVWNVEFSPDRSRLATASDDGTARVWDAATGTAVSPPLRHTGRVRAAVFSPDGAWVATAGLSGAVRVWDAVAGGPASAPLRHGHHIGSVTFSPDGNRVGTASADGTARVWDVRVARPAGPPCRDKDGFVSAALSPDRERVVTATDKTARVWHARTGRPACPTLEHGGSVSLLAFAPDGDRVLTAGDGLVRVWNASTGAAVVPALKHGGRITEAVFSPDGTRVATAGDDGTARVWELARGGQAGAVIRHATEVWQVGFSPDGTRVVTGSDDRTARVWDAATGAPVTPPLDLGTEVVTVGFSPDGARVAAGGDLTARVWDAATGAPVGPAVPCGDTVYHLVFAPGGRLVVAGNDGSARVWDPEAGTAVALPLRHGREISAVAVSPDGAWVATASEDRTARVWDAATGLAVTPPLRHGHEVRAAGFTPDGSSLVTVDADGRTREWLLIPDPRPVDDLVRLAELLSGNRVDPTGGLVPLPAAEIGSHWADLRARNPEEFAPPGPDQVAAWHTGRAAAAEAGRDWFAAAFHLRRQLRPESAAAGWRPLLRARLAHAEEQRRLATLPAAQR